MRAKNARRKRTQAEIKAKAKQERQWLRPDPASDDEPLTEEDKDFCSEYLADYIDGYNAFAIDSFRQIGCHEVSKFDPAYCPRIGLIKK